MGTVTFVKKKSMNYSITLLKKKLSVRQEVVQAPISWHEFWNNTWKDQTLC